MDTHGLPIENHVEKKLGLKTKKDIEELGIEKFNKACHDSVRENEAAFTNLTNQNGQFIDVEHPYLTYKTNTLKQSGWILKQYFEKGLFYEGKQSYPILSKMWNISCIS